MRSASSPATPRPVRIMSIAWLWPMSRGRRTVPGTALDLDAAAELTRTGDIWLFRGSSVADRAIRVTTNSPVNHVGMSVVLDDLPPLMWHAELGRSLPDMWTGTHQRGVQLHVLRDAATVWANRYGQRGWLRQLDTRSPGRWRMACCARSRGWTAPVPVHRPAGLPLVPRPAARVAPALAAGRARRLTALPWTRPR